MDANAASGDNKSSSKLRRISYFSDFIFMQQLMTLEIDIILGNIKNDMSHLGKNTNDEEEDDDKKDGKDKPQPGPDEGKRKKPHFSLDFENLDLNSTESNWDKIGILERTMNNFFKIFMSK